MQVAKIRGAEAIKYKGQGESKLYVAVLWKIMLSNMWLMAVKVVYKERVMEHREMEGL